MRTDAAVDFMPGRLVESSSGRTAGTSAARIWPSFVVGRTSRSPGDFEVLVLAPCLEPAPRHRIVQRQQVQPAVLVEADRARKDRRPASTGSTRIR
jgi:hypothetical protein